MKLDRLLGIVIHLLRSESATAQELADRFEVSTRTITRDLEDIAKAGIPLSTRRGKGGGIFIEKSYRIRDALLTENELRDLLAGVAAMDSVTRQRREPALREKLAAPEQNWITIDLHMEQGLFETLRDAILAQGAVRITYCYAKGEVQRVVEPLQLVYKWGGWYLIAYCQLRQDFRLFRIGRIRDVVPTGERFSPKPIPAGMLLPDPDDPPIALTALYAPHLRYLLLEMHAQDLTPTPDGRLQATMYFANPTDRLQWALRFGADIEVLSPETVKEEVLQHALAILK